MEASSKRVVAVTLAMVAVGLGAHQAATAVAGREDRWLAPVDVRPHGGQDVRGVARLTGAPGGPAAIIAILIGLRAADARGDVHLALGRAPCATLGGPGALHVLPRPLEVAPDGSARVDRPLPDAAAGARSLAVVGDGPDGIVACGDIERLTPARGTEDADGTLVATRPSVTGDGQILGNLLYNLLYVLGQPSFPVVLTSLMPGATYDVGLSRRPCGQIAQGKHLHPDIPVLQVVADEHGTAYASVTDVPVADTDWRSLVVSSSGADTVVDCARTDTLEVMLAD